MITIVVWQWAGFRDYTPAHVNRLAALFHARTSIAHQFVCITDERIGFSSDVIVFPTPLEALALAGLKSPEGPRFPTCYRRLWMFSKEAAQLGDRLMLLDLDAIPVADCTPFMSTPGAFVGWRPIMKWGDKLRVGGGLYLLQAGSRANVWEQFERDPARAIAAARASGFRGSDQAWMSFCLGVGETYWPADSGIYSIRDLREGKDELPSDARLVQFNGPQKPWSSSIDWVRRAWSLG